MHLSEPILVWEWACPTQREHMLTSALACGQSPGASCKVCSKKLIQASAGEKVSSDWCVVPNKEADENENYLSQS